jgi:hypothetical protein
VYLTANLQRSMTHLDIGWMNKVNPSEGTKASNFFVVAVVAAGVLPAGSLQDLRVT